MSKKHFIIFSLVFAFLIIASNITVRYSINEWLTYGAIVYPFTYLFSDILSESFDKKHTLKVVQLGAVLAVIPTLVAYLSEFLFSFGEIKYEFISNIQQLFISDFRVVLGSITAFFFIQQLDVYIFHALKKKYANLWWLRNNASTIISQFFDTLVFWSIAFGGVMPFESLIKLMLGDYAIKVIAALLDTPFFYAFAIKIRHTRLFQAR